ncbi:MAG TPA: hypothetical protein VMU54_09080, partial [Planctomycetota bacterium]|nr:hypothetical protein [Planctomycetota bacterium]
KDRSQGEVARVLELAAASGGVAEAEALGLEALANLRGSQEAERAALERISNEPASAPLRFLRSLLLLDLGREKEAAEELRKVLYLDPSLAAAQFTLGMILKRRGERSGARRAFRNVLRTLSGMPPGEKLPLAPGETAGRLGDLARGELALLEGSR